jgi:ADP-ribose pyrophosphatase YjhB (NUDIX family)
LDLPDGFIDLGETTETCVKREVKEELNLDVTDLRFFGTFPNRYQFGGLTYFTIDIIFECAVKTVVPLMTGDDAAKVHFIHPKEIDLDQIGSDYNLSKE